MREGEWGVVGGVGQHGEVGEWQDIQPVGLCTPGFQLGTVYPKV